MRAVAAAPVMLGEAGQEAGSGRALESRVRWHLCGRCGMRVWLAGWPLERALGPSNGLRELSTGICRRRGWGVRVRASDDDEGTTLRLTPCCELRRRRSAWQRGGIDASGHCTASSLSPERDRLTEIKRERERVASAAAKGENPSRAVPRSPPLDYATILSFCIPQ